MLAGGTLRIGSGFTDDLGTRTLELAIGGGTLDTNGVDVTATGLALSGTGDLVKTGLGTLTLAGTPTDTSTGTLIVQRGVLELADAGGSNAFGSGDVEIRPIAFGGSTVTLRNGASDQIDDAATVRIFNVGGGTGAPSGGRWELNGFSETIGGLEMTSGSGSATIVTLAAGSVLTVNGDITLNNNRGGTGTSAEQVEITGAGALDLGGVARRIEVNSTVTAAGTDAGIETIIQNGGIIKEGAHILHLENAANTYTGGTFVNEGTVSIATDTNLGADAPGNGIELSNGGTLQSTGGSVIFSANRTVLLDGSGGQIDVVGGTSNVLQVDSIISGHDCASLTKLGTGALVLTQANTYEGGTVLSEGTLLAVNGTGSATGSGSVTTAASTVLGGSGFIAPSANNNVTVDGQLLVGIPTLDTQGTDLSIVTSGTGTFSLGAGSTTILDLWSGAGTGDNTGSPASADVLIVGGASGVTVGGTLQLDNPNNMSAWAQGDAWRLFDWTSLTGGVTGTFSNLTGNVGNFTSLPDLSSLALAWDVSNIYTTGVITIVPQPSRVMLVLCGILGMLLRRRRR